MNKDVESLMKDAEYWRSLYRCGGCDRDTAKSHIMPYIDAVNAKAKELASKYNQKPRFVSFTGYVR